MTAIETSGTLLLVIERAHRGLAEVQYSDLLYVARGLADQQDGVHLALRGDAVTAAVTGSVRAHLARIGDLTLDPVANVAAGLCALLQRGTTVWVDGPDLDRAGIEHTRLLDGVRLRDTDELIAAWPAEKGIWFL